MKVALLLIHVKKETITLGGVTDDRTSHCKGVGLQSSKFDLILVAKVAVTLATMVLVSTGTDKPNGCHICMSGSGKGVASSPTSIPISHIFIPVDP